MELTKVRRQFRNNVIEDLQLLGSADAQLQFQRDVPFVNISVELVCNWFDGCCLPKAEEFLATFYKRELQAITTFNAEFEAVFAAFPDDEPMPEISELLLRPEWKRLIDAATIALLAFE